MSMFKSDSYSLMYQPFVVRFSATLRVLGVLMMIFSLSMLPPIAVSIIFHDGAEWSFLSGFALTLLAGFFIWLPFRDKQYELKTRDGFLVVVLFWTVLSLFGALPLYIDLFPYLSFTDALFETVSGLTTTGATIFTHVSTLPRAILYYRQQLHFLGGMGIIVLAIAILPMLGIGGMQLYRAETVGPIKTNKLRPRMAQTAKALWAIYVGLVIICALCFWLAGMRPLDAIGESFSALSTGGFSMHDSSFAYYHSNLIDSIAIVFMLLGAANFGLHFQFLKERRPSVYIRDTEFRSYLIFLAAVIGIVIVTLVISDHYHRGEVVMNAIFTIVSVSTTTGFTTADFSTWPTFLPYMIMFVAIIGGCGGSTSGGIKMIRVLLLREQGRRELKRLIHPNSVVAVKLGDQVLSDEVIQTIWAFVALFSVLFVVLLLILLATGMPIKTAFGALASCISNTGAAIGGVATSFEHIPTFSKWVLIFAMLAGRLEIFTIFVLFTREYWRK